MQQHAVSHGAPIGGLIEGGGNRPLPLDTGLGAYRLVQGYADIFVLDCQSDARRHLFRAEQGAVIISTGPVAVGLLMAIGGLGSRFQRIGIDDARTACGEWIRGINAAVAEAQQWPNHLVEGQRLSLSEGETCSSAGGEIAYVLAETPGLSWNGVSLSAGTLFPLAAPAMLMATSEAALRPVPVPSAAEVGEGLEQLAHATIEWAARSFAADRLAGERREHGRDQASARRFSDALGALATTRQVRRVSQNPWLHAVESVLEAFGQQPDSLPDAARRRAAEAKAFEPILADLLLDHRPIVLAEGWWKRDGMPMLAQTTDGEPLALLPTGNGRFRAVGASIDRKVDATLAASIRLGALQVYPMLENRSLGMSDLMRFASRGLGRDARRIALTALLAAATMASLPIATGILFDSVVPMNDRAGLVQLALLLIAAALGQSLFELTRAMSVARMEAALDAKLQAAIMLRLLSLPVRFFQRFSVGDLGQRALGLQEVRQILTASTLSGLFGLVGAVTSMVTMLFINWRLALLAVIPFAVMMLVSGWISRRQLRHERERVRFNGQVEGFLLQVLVGLPKLRAAAAEMRAFAEWAWRSMPERRAFERARFYSGWQTVAVAVLPSLSLLFIFGCLLLVFKYETTQAALSALVTGTGAPDDAGSMSAGMFVAFAAAFGQASSAFVAAVTASSELLSIGPLVARTLPLLEAEPEVGSKREAPGRLSGEIAFNRVHFRYGKDGPLVLRDVNFTIRPGEYVAIVGESGSGKSTIMRLLLGFDTPEEGAVFFDCKPADRLDTAALRAEIGVVLQNGRISPGSVYHNIAGASGHGMEAAWAAARLVALAPDIEAMPMGMHTVLNDGGSALSGGQRQRILLARALVGEPNILLLDEATSALDNRTQRVVTDTLARLSVTRIVIAHRLSTIMNVDRIFVMDKGRLVESGTYEQLMEAQGAFHALARRQLLEKEG
ncbi:NHLP bacteriocin export ABC transporter permease/ATPase subunit [Mesorhizobium sp. ANAO-SY3R2]|uniref:NHLP bacteriocin export ABC transporter permease/ATPase subunit n=1 Tax=Mesorhizobium sp. ANAO-SY3R2 TaxID=3166644 RepID=UPI00366AA9CE